MVCQSLVKNHGENNDKQITLIILTYLENNEFIHNQLSNKKTKCIYFNRYEMSPQRGIILFGI